MPSYRVVRLILVSLLVMPAYACIVDEVNFNQADTFTCTSDEDCVTGFVCLPSGFCGEEQIDIDCEDKDNDGASVGTQCPTGQEQDCDDDNNKRAPGRAEECDQIDNDCNDIVDDNVQPVACPLTQGVCGTANAMQTCDNGTLTECDYGSDYVSDESLATASCNDNLDNDCDGKADKADENCPDCEAGIACGTGCLGPVPESQCACKMGTITCNPDGSSVCKDSNGNDVIVTFQQTEVPNNNMDDDCDGTVD